MKRPASTRSLLPFPLPFRLIGHLTKLSPSSNCLMDCENSSGLATACSYWMSAAPNSSPSPTVCSHLGVPKKNIHQQNAWLTPGERQVGDIGDDDLPF